MDNILKAKYVQLKEHLNFHVDIKNIKFYKSIKTFVNESIFLFTATGLSLLFSSWLFQGNNNILIHFFFSLFFLPFFFSYVKRLDLKFKPKFTQFSHKLPGFLKAIPFIKSAEDSFFFSRDKIATMLQDKNFQLVFFDFFNMAKHHIFKTEEQRHFTQQLVLFKSFLELANYTKAADQFMELYAKAQQFEYLVYDDYQSYHDIELLKTRKKLIDEFLEHVEVDDLSQQNVKSKSIFLHKEAHGKSQPNSYDSHDTHNSESNNKINWKKLMDE